ncbi:hypothetical protein KKY_2710 [Pelagibacterium halotolerans B2]|uniref:Uncharacterized protein n=1 Tax=Pelagibacterium halotolerans (strain DSM 22347 / JCM 15775 / CGMCC 1.7692 / B2) TaxID=1082931 RepID=G4RC93_PELHB|nr:hypothetical protein KKY_2710 [Pelagibacterium halotolerans B2]
MYGSGEQTGLFTLERRCIQMAAQMNPSIGFRRAAPPLSGRALTSDADRSGRRSMLRFSARRLLSTVSV